MLDFLPFFIPFYPQNYKQPSPEPHEYAQSYTNFKKPTQTKILKSCKIKQNNLEWLLPLQKKKKIKWGCVLLQLNLNKNQVQRVN